MTVKQISVFVENKAGGLDEVTSVLAENKINMRALSIADTKDFGILRLIVDDPDKTVEVLRNSGFVLSVTPVLAVAIVDEPGGLSRILGYLSSNGVNLEYAYAFITRKSDSAYMILRVENVEKALSILTANEVEVVGQSAIEQL